MLLGEMLLGYTTAPNQICFYLDTMRRTSLCASRCFRLAMWIKLSQGLLLVCVEFILRNCPRELEGGFGGIAGGLVALGGGVLCCVHWATGALYIFLCIHTTLGQQSTQDFLQRNMRSGGELAACWQLQCLCAGRRSMRL